MQVRPGLQCSLIIETIESCFATTAGAISVFTLILSVGAGLMSERISILRNVKEPYENCGTLERRSNNPITVRHSKKG
jgi:hypothetical protein